MPQVQGLEIGSYPLPDPAWDFGVSAQSNDYARLWEFLHKDQGDLNNLIQYTTQIEEASPETDQAIGLRRELSRTDSVRGDR
jgi:hypothetical protein